MEAAYSSSLLSLEAREADLQNITSENPNLTPFDERTTQARNNISTLQAEAVALVERHSELVLLYDDVLFAVNDTLRNRLIWINGSLDTLKRVFTTVYVTAFTTQELMEVLVSEFTTALDVVRRIETVDVPVIADVSQAIQSDAANVSITAQELEAIVADSSAQVERLRNATYEILSLSASVLEDVGELAGLQEQVRSEVERITAEYASLDSDVEAVDSRLTRYETELAILAGRVRAKRASLVEAPAPDLILELTGNATATEAFVRNDVLREIENQRAQFLTLNDTYTVQRNKFDRLFGQVSELGMNVSALLDSIQSAYAEAQRLAESSRELVEEAEMVASNLESFDNETFRIGREVAEAMADVDSLNRDASRALSEAERLEEGLRNTSQSLQEAKAVASDALDIANTSLQVCSLYFSNHL